MHEYHLVRSLIKSILEKTSSLKNFKKVTLIRVTLGDLKMVTPESFIETFKELSRGTPCEGAALEIKEVKGNVLMVEGIEGEFNKE